MTSFLSLTKRIFLPSFLGVVILFTVSACETAIEVTQQEEQKPPDPDTPEGWLLPRLKEILTPLAQRETAVSAEEISASLVRSGIDTTDLEIQESVTPTGLQADSIALALPTEENCVFGYVRGQDVATAILPKLNNGACFIGGKRPGPTST